MGFHNSNLKFTHFNYHMLHFGIVDTPRKKTKKYALHHLKKIMAFYFPRNMLAVIPI